MSEPIPRRAPTLNAGRRTGWWGAWRQADNGSVTTETTLIAPVLIMFLVFVAVLIHRGVDARLRLEDAAHQAARAASLEHTGPAAASAALSTAQTALAASGLACASLAVDANTGGLVPGGTVAVTLSCTVDFGDALILGIPGQKQLSATATEPIDSYRSVSGNIAGRRS